MRVCGVICEYNPFHNGHAYHLRAVRERSGCDYVVCVMSGHFTQRGHAALLSKWARAEMALRCGADAVFELPTLFAVRDAQRFARGGVSLLASLGVVTHLGFGSETGELAGLAAHAGAEVDLALVRKGLSEGMTLARARGLAQGMASDAPNDALAVEYLRALALLGQGIEPVVVRREGASYHDEAMGGMASATAVRAAIWRGEDVYGAVPPQAYALLRRMLEAGAYQSQDGLDTVLLAVLRSMTAEKLAKIADVGEGLENRLLRAAQEATSREALIVDAKCKRYTWARLSRVATQAMLGMTHSLAAQHPLPAYARLLGFRQDAQPLMAEITRCANVPIVTRAAKFRLQGNAAFALDLRAGDLWALGLAEPSWRKGSMDVTQPVVIVE